LLLLLPTHGALGHPFHRLVVGVAGHGSLAPLHVA
jgi:hypothetical protein